jgi:hypothetical protein
MKIRNGFVSNSSSSSFTIYGADLEMEDIKKFIPEDVDTSGESYEWDIEWWSLAQDIEKALGEDFSCFTDYENGDVYVGRELKSLKDDETGKQFRDSVDIKIRETFDDGYTCGNISETVQS